MSGLLLVLVSVCALSGFVYARSINKHIKPRAEYNEQVSTISSKIYAGARLFIHKEYRALFTVVFVMALLIIMSGSLAQKEGFNGPLIALVFMIGACGSALAGYLSMRTATRSNKVAVNHAQKSLGSALFIGTSAGTVTGLNAVSIGFMSIIAVLAFLLYIAELSWFGAINLLAALSMGASVVALFARVGGGIFTKAADMSADTFGKLHHHYKEDDPNNPLVLADAVGDNVGDVAGMGADLYESYIGSIIAALLLGYFTIGFKGIILSLLIVAAGIIISCVSHTTMHGKPIERAVRRPLWIGSAAMIGISAVIVQSLFPGNITYFLPILIGLATGLLISLATEYFTGAQHRPVKMMAKSSKQGAGMLIIEGMQVSSFSAAAILAIIAVATMLSYSAAGVFGIALAAVAMLSLLATSLAADAMGPIVDNAGTLARMAKLPEIVRKRTDRLDAVGNMTAATGKGFAIGSAALTAIALIATIQQAGRIDVIDMTSAPVFVGIWIGVAIVFAFNGLIMRSVVRAAEHLVQHAAHKNATHETSVAHASTYALHAMALPGALAVLIPILVGLISIHALIGVLVGALVTGIALAIYFANSGGSWDNAKKYVEAHPRRGNSENTITGDIVGDALKDAAGPALNILIKVMAIIALVFLPLFL